MPDRCEKEWLQYLRTVVQDVTYVLYVVYVKHKWPLFTQEGANGQQTLQIDIQSKPPAYRLRWLYLMKAAEKGSIHNKIMRLK